MKSIALTLTLAAAITIIACGKKSETTETAQTTVESTKHMCYTHLENKDTVKMTITIQDTNVSGELTYQLFEKDRNYGQFHGTISGDTIVADYEFQSEGMMSTRQVSFLLRQDKSLVEGYDGKFDGLVLLETSCDK